MSSASFSAYFIVISCAAVFSMKIFLHEINILGGGIFWTAPASTRTTSLYEPGLCVMFWTCTLSLAAFIHKLNWQVLYTWLVLALLFSHKRHYLHFIILLNLKKLWVIYTVFVYTGGSVHWHDERSTCSGDKLIEWVLLIAARCNCHTQWQLFPCCLSEPSFSNDWNL